MVDSMKGGQWQRLSVDDRHSAQVNKVGPLPKWAPFLGPCWIWTGTVDRWGYARFRVNGKSVMVHRWAYERWVGPIGDGMTIDHLCRVAGCSNPEHLEQVTQRDNNLRGDTITARHVAVTHCPQGHEYTPENCLPRKDGRRDCRTCNKERQSRRDWGAERRRRQAANS